MGCAESTENRNKEPTGVRGCTDVIWLAIYIFFWLLMIVIAIFSFVYGNPLRLINGYDSFGNTCGVKYNERYTNFPLSGMNTLMNTKLFILDIKELRQSIKICVKSCPKTQINDAAGLYNYFIDTGNQLCRYDFNMSLLLQPARNDIKYFDYMGPCPTFPIYESSSVLNRCIPKGENVPGKHVKSMYSLLNSWDVAQQFLSDLYKSWPTLVLLSGLALIFSLILIAMMQWLTKIVSWVICIFVGVVSIALTIVLWWAYYNVKNKTHENIKYSMLEEFARNESAIFILAILATIAMIVLLVVIYFLRSKISGLAALFEEASICMFDLPGLIGPPILAFIALIIFLVFWIIVVLGLATANYPGMKPLLPFATVIKHNTTLEGSVYKNNSSSDYKTFMKVEYTEASWLRNMFWFYVIGLIWTTEFIFACQQLAIAGAIAFWYFRKPTDSPVLHSISKLIKYHLGSVAKGAFIITIFKIPRLILTYLYAKMKKGEDNGSGCAKCGLKCCICCFWLLEKFIRYLNHNAYTVIAIESVNFCPAAGIAWNAMATNILQVATINGIGDFILFLGKIFVAAICALIGVLMLRDREEIYFYIAPVILAFVFAFFIAHVVLSLYEIIVDTLFLCVCEDKTINGQSGRWKTSNLAKLVGEEPIPAEEQAIQTVEMAPINKQPFSSVAA